MGLILLGLLHKSAAALPWGWVRFVLSFSRQVQLLIEPQIQKEECCFSLGCGIMDMTGGGMGVCQINACVFGDLEKAYDHFPRGVLWGAPGVCVR